MPGPPSEAYLGELDLAAVTTAAAETLVPGRVQVVDQDPMTVLDGAHNPEGMAALAEALDDPFAAGRRPVVAVISILDDKDAAAMLSTLMPKCDAMVLTASHNTARAAAAHAGVAGRPAGRPARRGDPRSPSRAGARPRDRRSGRPGAGHRHDLPGGGSAPPGRRRPGVDAVNEEEKQPRFIAMIGLVALIVAVVILVFFGIGYLFGRAYL